MKKTTKHNTISSLEELSVCLQDDRQPIRLSALSAIYQQLIKKESKNKKIHPDLFALIYDQYKQTKDKVERLWCACILLQTSDSRRFSIAKREFFENHEGSVLIIFAEAMAQLSPSERADLFGPVVMEGKGAARQRLAANLLSDCTSILEPDVSLRVAILSNHDIPIPELTKDNLNLWINELSGPYRMNVKKILSAKDDASFVLLIKNWSKLSVDLAIWVMDQAAQKNICGVERMLLQILEEVEDSSLIRHTLKTLASIETIHVKEEILKPFYRHKDLNVVAAAFVLGKADLEWEKLLDPEEPDELRLAVLQRIRINELKSSLSYVDPLLRDKSWKIRARAAEALAALAPDSLAVLDTHLASNHREARVSALKARQMIVNT